MCPLRQALAVPHARALPIRVVHRVAVAVVRVVRVRLRVPGGGAVGGLQVLVLLLLLVLLVGRGLGGLGRVGGSASRAPEGSKGRRQLLVTWKGRSSAEGERIRHARCSAYGSPLSQAVHIRAWLRVGCVGSGCNS